MNAPRHENWGVTFLGGLIVALLFVAIAVLFVFFLKGLNS